MPVLLSLIEINSVRTWARAVAGWSRVGLPYLLLLACISGGFSGFLTHRRSMASTGGSDMPGRRTGDGHLAAGAQGSVVGPGWPSRVSVEERR